MVSIEPAAGIGGIAVGDAVRVERGTLVGNPFAVYGLAQVQKKIASGNTEF
ncbi:hypothetical protein [Burkholderia territorii]|uniref:hypothetical protein n=1 Tax=Burkholderia territorii TaxID=1503055 RepID=UPI000ACC8B4E|nr:hypothetical protein [Burkholderia territorii]